MMKSLLLKHEISGTFESFKNLKDLYDWVARQLYLFTNAFSISGNHFVLPPIFMIDMVRFGHVTVSCKEPIPHLLFTSNWAAVIGNQILI